MVQLTFWFCWCVAQKAVLTGPVAPSAPHIGETERGRSSCWPAGKAK